MELDLLEQERCQKSGLENTEVDQLQHELDNFFSNLEQIDAVDFEVLSRHLVEVVCFENQVQSFSV